LTKAACQPRVSFVPDGGGREIDQMVEEAILEFDYFRHGKDYALFRYKTSRGPWERLVDGRWVRVRTPRFASENRDGPSLKTEDLCTHVRRYLVAGLNREALRWAEDFTGRFWRSSFGRWIFPPLKGGAGRRLGGGAAERSRRAHTELLVGIESEDLAELREQAFAGYEHQQQRGERTEQRANFFLVAAGLTSSLVLANAGLLLGTSSLKAPWHDLAVLALLVGSICAVAAGLRAMQAVMFSFFRTPPNAVDRVLDRSVVSGEDLVRTYVGALLVAQSRLGVIGDWKVARLRGARLWFIGAITGVVFLTIFVLAEAL
jgi:hypothetical protein